MWGLFGQRRTGRIRAGVMQDGKRIELAVVRRLPDGTLSVDADNVESERPDIDWARDSHAGIDQKDLDPALVSRVLDANAYSLHLIEKPSVPQEEMSEAIRWSLQNLIEFPISEAVIETFEMPQPVHASNVPMIHAVVVHRDEILSVMEQIKAARLHLDIIDIPELCIRNIAVRLPQDKDGVAFLHFTDDCGYLSITRQGVLYMIRRIETRRGDVADSPSDALAQLDRSSGVALEVQRSLDYYESHYDRAPITELVLGPGPNLVAHSSTLAESLGINVTRLNLDDLFTVGTEIHPDVQSDCLLVIGAALRDSAHTHAEAA